jgi:hypothetical protein
LLAVVLELLLVVAVELVAIDVQFLVKTQAEEQVQNLL